MPGFYADKVLNNEGEVYCVGSWVDWALHFMTLCRPMSEFHLGQDDHGNPN